MWYERKQVMLAARFAYGIECGEDPEVVQDKVDNFMLECCGCLPRTHLHEPVDEERILACQKAMMSRDIGQAFWNKLDGLIADY